MNKVCIVSILAVAILSCVSCSSSKVPLQQDWQAVIDSYQDNGTGGDYLRLVELNLALLHTGRLVDDAFSYTQAGYEGMVPSWNQNLHSGRLLSDIYFAVGHVALAQRMAFESSLLSEYDYDPAMLRRLVQTNLIYGAYPVARKYLRILSSDSSSALFCEHYSAIVSDEDVSADSLLGPLRLCIPAQDFICPVNNLEDDLRQIIEANPSYTKTLDFLGMLYLMDCNTEGFRSFLDDYYGSEMLPSLHGAFAEAACIMSELEPGYWRKVGISRSLYDEYRDFRSRLESGLSLEKYKGTFWYYIMKVNTHEISR